LAAADCTEQGHAAETKSTLVARKTDADITANIKTAPIGDGTISRRRRIDRRTGCGWRQIGCARAKRRERKNPYRC
jgi:hypothetical protein